MYNDDEVIVDFVENRLRGVCKACNNYEACKASGKNTRGSHQNCWQSFLERFDKNAEKDKKKLQKKLKQSED